ncbi:MAG TPA: metallophosphoesterase [Polyangiaceae bacterium]|nr:metallophosphoesterase [Polyangiaceae bacterium]
MSGWSPRSGLGALACVSLPLLAACLRPGEERARRDERVGQARGDGVRVEVAFGHAAVRSLARDRVRLWAAAPRLSLTLDWDAGPPGEVAVEVNNCMPGAQLSTPDAVVISSERGAGNLCAFRLGSVAGSTARVEIEPPGADQPSPFSFAVMSDVQEAIDRVQDIYRVMNQEEGIDFLLGAGDLTEQGTREQLERFERELGGLTLPYYTTLGNHELGESPSLYQDFFGRGSQSFEYRGARFTLLDSASASIDPIVFGWLDEWLEQGRGSGHVVAMHIPPLDPIGVRNGAFANRNEAAKLLGRLAAAGVDLTLYGHIHSYYHFENAGMPAHVSGGGGAIPERFDDIGRHFLVVDVEPVEQVFDVRVVRVD